MGDSDMYIFQTCKGKPNVSQIWGICGPYIITHTVDKWLADIINWFEMMACVSQGSVLGLLFNIKFFIND